jgi:hypothetical protein
MSDLTTEQGNKLIAEFDGWVLDNSFPDKERTYRKGSSVELDTTFKYHKDWNALMPVISKINDLASPDNWNQRNIFKSSAVLIGNALCDCDIIKTHECVALFIQWHNEKYKGGEGV